VQVGDESHVFFTSQTLLFVLLLVLSSIESLMIVDAKGVVVVVGGG
jgi:hypothetical protein